MIEIRLRTSPRDLNKRLSRGGKIAADELTVAIHKLGYAAHRKARKEAPLDTGLLRASIGLETRRLRAWIGSHRRHAAPMEYGAEPHWPPHEPIYNWVWRNRTKFGIVTPSGRAARGPSAQQKVAWIAFAVRRTIARRGLDARRYLRKALEDVIRRAPRIAGSVAKKIAIRLVER